MNQTYMGCHVVNLFRSFLALMLIVMLSACGGGGGSAGATSGGNNQYPNGKISLALFDQNGVASNLISSSNSLTAKATVTNSSGAPVVGVVVTFVSDATVAVLSPTTGTALTNSSGVAQISVQAGSGTGAGTLTASANAVGTTAVSSSATFSVSAPPAAVPVAVNFISAAPADKAIVIKGAGGNGRTEVALLTYSVVDSSGVGIANRKVNFTTQSTKAVSLSAPFGTTDATGNVVVALNSGTEPTTVRVNATVDGTSISTVSDTITVTTGAPVQAAMSISLGSFWAEGINFDGIQIKIAARLADAFGGAVADGTQVVFTVDGGSIAGNSGAKCLTGLGNITGTSAFPGFCDVFWTSQNPRPVNGVATIVATATSGTALLSQSAQFYVLGSFAKIYQVQANDIEGNTNRITAGGAISMDFSSSCAKQALYFEVVDQNENPMPPASTITASGANGSTVVVAVPASVPNWNMALGYGVVSHRGTVHRIDVTPPSSCDTTSALGYTDSFNVTVTTPLKVGSSTQVLVKYKK
jgi:hypothetical protein